MKSILSLWLVLPVVVWAQHPGHDSHRPAMASSYAGEQVRTIKALSEDQITAYLEGQGAGMAKAAELNGYPGPLHVLELAQALQLTEKQRSQTADLLTRHQAEARRLGAELVEAERALDQAFASRSIDHASLRHLSSVAAEKQGRLRAEHLQTHLRQTALLNPGQITHYLVLRGYRNEPTETHHEHHKH